MNKRLFSDLTTDEKLTVLEKLLQNPEIRRQAEDIAASIAVEKVKEEDIYRRVSHAVGNLDIAEDVWAHSGRTRHGYVDVYDKADEVFDDAIRPFMHTLAQYRKTSLVEQATAYCCGLIRGIMDVDSEYLEWIPDAPRERIDSIVEEFSTWAPAKCVQKVRKCYEEIFPPPVVTAVAAKKRQLVKKAKSAGQSDEKPQ